jgi:hypothetical protein
MEMPIKRPWWSYLPSYAIQDFTSVLTGGGGLARALGSITNNFDQMAMAAGAHFVQRWCRNLDYGGGRDLIDDWLGPARSRHPEPSAPRSGASSFPEDLVMSPSAGAAP